MKFRVAIKDVMKKKVLCISPKDPVQKAAKLMSENKTGYVVVGTRDSAKGIITTTDIVRRFVAKGCKAGKAESIMTRDFSKINEKKTLEDAAHMIVKRNVEKLVVINDKDEITGIITTKDILKIEPALLEVLIESMKMYGRPGKRDREEAAECESCGNYSENLKSVNGQWLCEECRGE